jgi:hypothetical protein
MKQRKKNGCYGIVWSVLRKMVNPDNTGQRAKEKVKKEKMCI